MEFNSLRDFFLKLYIRLYVILLAPILLLAAFYLRSDTAETTTLLPMAMENIEIICGIIVLGDWLVAIIFFRSRLKTIISLLTLRERLLDYSAITVLQFILISGGALLLCGAFYVTGSSLIGGLLLLDLSAVIFIWPFPVRVCNNLRLKGDERKVVQYRLDSL